MDGKLVDSGNIIHGPSLLTDQDIYLFREGNHFRLFEKLGAHLTTVDDVEGTLFTVWAPNAAKVSVIGDLIAGIRKRIPWPQDGTAPASGRDSFPV